MSFADPDWVPPIEMNFDVEKPIRSEQGFLLAGNPIAIANGKPGAPRIQRAAVQDGAINAPKLATGTTERDWVLARTSGADAGAVGTYAFLGETSGTTGTTFGGTRAGSALRPAGIRAPSSFANTGPGFTGHSGQDTALSGTWRCMGVSRSVVTGAESNDFGATLWLRIS